MPSLLSTLRVAIEAQGIAKTVAGLQAVESEGKRAADSAERMERKFSNLDRSVGDFNRTMAGLRNTMRLVKFPALIAGAGVAAQAIGALAGGAVGLASALAPLVGLAAAAGAGFVAAAQGMGVFQLATFGIVDALKEQFGLQAKIGPAAARSAGVDISSAKAVQAAQDGVRQAREGVRQATVDVTDAIYAQGTAARDVQNAIEAEKNAQISLTQAVRDAKRGLVDLHESLKDAVLSERSAAIDLEEARNNLAQVTANATSTDLEKRKAALAVAEAENRLADAQRERGRLSRDVARADKDGVKGSQGVVSAEQALKSAHQGVTDAQHQQVLASRATGDAQRALVDAQRQVLRATQAVGDAQKTGADASIQAAGATAKLSAKMASLPAPAQAFVRVLLSLKPQLDALRNAAAGGLFPGAARGIIAATRNFAPLRAIVHNTATAMGDLAERAGTLVGSSGFGRDLATVGRRNVTIMEHVGNAALALGDAFRHVVVVAGPLTSWLARLTQTGADWIRSQVLAGRESGRLAAFLNQTRQVMSVLIQIAINLGAAFYQIGRAAAPLGRVLLRDIENLTARFRAWTESVQGQQTLQQYFRDALGPIREMAGLVGDLGGAFLRLSRPTGATTGMIGQLRELVPVLESVISSTSAAFAPAFIESLTQVVRLLGELAGTSGPLTLFVQAIGLLAGALADLLASSPALNQMLVFGLGLKSVWGALAVLGPPVAAAFTLVTTASFRTAAAARAVAVSTALMQASVLLPVAALVALGAAFVVAYTQSATFRRIVDSVVEWLKQAWPEAMAILVTSTRAAMNVLRAIWYLNIALFAPPVVAMWTLVKGTFSGAFTIIQGIVRGGFQVIRGIVTLFTGLIKGDFGQMWEGVKQIFHGGITALRGILDGAWRILRAPVDAIAAGLREGFTNAWDSVKKAFESGVNALIGFLNLLREGLNIVLRAVGVKPIPAIPQLGAGRGGGGGRGQAGSFGGTAPASGALARGGAFARTGGHVTKPITLMGEEAPRHPEFVIPTNPAYRGRAQNLVMQAAGAVGMARGGKVAMDRLQGVTREPGTAVPGRAIGVARGGMLQADRQGQARRASSARAQARKVAAGYAQGGIYSQGEIENLWTDQGGASARRLIASAIAMAESSGNANATSANPAGGRNLGLWQIWTGNPGSTLDPGGNARTAIRLSRNGTDWGLWETFTNGAYKQFLGKGRAGGQIGGLPAISDVLGKFPSVNDLPEWVRGVGKFMVDKATDFVKKQIGGLFSEGSGTGLAAKGKGGVGSFQGIPMANWVIDSLRYAQSKGVEVRPTSGYRPGFDPHTASGASEHQGTRYPHGAVDFGGYHDAAALAMKMAVVNATADFRYPLRAPIGFVDDGHASGTGHARGGIYGDVMTAFRQGGKLIGQTAAPEWLGAFKAGGFTGSREGLAYLHKHEAVIPMARGGGPHNLGRGNLLGAYGGRRWFQPSYGMPAPSRGAPRPGYTPPDVPEADTTTADAPDNQELIDAINANTEAVNAEAELERQRLALETIIQSNQMKILAMRGQGDQILAAIVAAVNGGIGGQVGLGFQSPSTAGAMARYK